MATIHITKDEATRNIATLLTRLDGNTSFVIEDGSEPIAVLRVPPSRELTFSEKLALLDPNAAFMDEDFASDVLDGIESHREPLDSSLWNE